MLRYAKQSRTGSMPRRNLFFLIAASVVSLLCYHNVQNNRYGRVLVEAMERVEQKFLGPVDPQALFEGAMDGMLDRLDDPNTGFVDAGELQRFTESLDQEFGGVGMEVSLDPDTKQITVIHALDGTPASRAGIRAGDKVLKIDGQSTRDMLLHESVKLMRGKLGEPVTLTILHEGDEEPVEITIERAIIHTDSVVGDRRREDGSWEFFLEDEPRIAHLRITSTFGKDTESELRRTLDLLSKQGLQGLVLDLRDNPGGLLEAAVRTCNIFIDEGVIVSTRRRDGSVKRLFKANPKDTYKDLPVAVLVNKFSASASEIVAACLQDHQRAVVVGERTYGKGTVQEFIELESGLGAMRLTTASYWRPSGKNIHRTDENEENGEWGVTPDEGYEVVVEGEELDRLHRWQIRRNGAEPVEDRQMTKAVEVIREAVGSRQ